MRIGGVRLGTALVVVSAAMLGACSSTTEVGFDCVANTDCVIKLDQDSLFIPGAALTEAIHIQATRVNNPPDSLTVIPGTSWNVEITPASFTTFNPAASLTLHVDADSLATKTQVRKSELGLYLHGVSGWSRLTQTVDTTALRISAQVSGVGLFAIMGAPAATITVAPPSFQVSVPGTQQLTATVRDEFATVLPLRQVTWSSSQTGFITVNASGLATAVAPGPATIRASIGTVQGTSNATVSGGGGGGSDPSPQTGDVIVLDFRAGGNKDLQACPDRACAVTKIGFLTSNVQFTTNFDGNNTRALVFPWVLNNGQASCTGNVGSQQDMFIETGANVTGPADIYLQYKIWMGRTATGGGTGTVGSYSNVNLGGGTPGGHKWWVWFRTPAGNSDGRLTGEQSPTLWKMITTPYPGYTGPAPGADNSIGEVHYFGTDVTTGAWNPDANLNKVNVLTYHIRSETANNAQNGLMEVWANGALVQAKSNLYTSPLGFQILQIGGPTWICPPQDQTHYVWDILVWRK